MNDLQNLIVGSLKANGFDRVCKVPLRQLAEDYLSEARIMEQVEMLKRYVPDLRGKRVLEVGSGFGMFVATCNRNGICEAWGIEPGADAYGSAYEISLKVLIQSGVPADRIRNAYGEAIPFEDASFDVVWSTNVLEHVRVPALVLSEIHRVLRPNGTAVIVVPNYGSWWEGHYGTLFPPHCPKPVFKAIMRVMGRDPSFVDTLQFVTYGKLEKWLAPFRDKVEIATYGQEIWESRVRTLAFSDWAALGLLKSVMRVIHRLRVVEPLVWIGKRLHWETPFTLVFRKLA